MTLSKEKIQNSLTACRKGLTFIVGIYLLSWVLKGIFLSVYVVPTSSMYPTIHKGDYIVTLKFPYRFKAPEFYPLTAVPFPFFSKPGFVEPEKEDVWVFHSPIRFDLHPSNRMTFVKRLAGLPGDTLFTIDNKIMSSVDSITVSANKHIIPKEGMIVKLDSTNITYWQRLIQRDESEINIDSAGQKIVINGEQKTSYQFKSDFYFMTGDNEGSTIDSRHWGAVPEYLLMGKAFGVIWRKKEGVSLYGL
jgi:signal peptidase I